MNGVESQHLAGNCPQQDGSFFIPSITENGGTMLGSARGLFLVGGVRPFPWDGRGELCAQFVRIVPAPGHPVLLYAIDIFFLFPLLSVFLFPSPCLFHLSHKLSPSFTFFCPFVHKYCIASLHCPLIYCTVCVICSPLVFCYRSRVPSSSGLSTLSPKCVAWLLAHRCMTIQVAQCSCVGSTST